MVEINISYLIVLNKQRGLLSLIKADPRDVSNVVAVVVII